MGDKALPYDAEIEYLESTGTQCIDTGVIGRSGVETELQFSVKTLAGVDNDIMGAAKSSPTVRIFCPCIYNLGISYGYGEAYHNLFAINPNTLYTVKGVYKVGNQRMTVNGTTVYTGTILDSYDTQCNLFLFLRNQSGSPRKQAPAKAKITYAKVWYDDTLVRDFIPVRVGQVGYMYDRVSGQLFGNSGTGVFILGPDV